MIGMKDQMKEIAVVIFDYGTSTDHGSEIFIFYRTVCKTVVFCLS